MVDETVQAAKIAAVADAVRRIREVLPSSAADLENDRTAREVVVLNLFVAIQEALSLATHWLAHGGRAVPVTYREVFLALAAEDVISDELARRLVGAAGFRNLVAHQYGALDAVRLFTIASNHAEDLLEFCRALVARTRADRAAPPKSD